MKKIIAIIFTLLLFPAISFAANQNIMVEDAINNFSKTFENVTSVKTIAIYPFEYSKNAKMRNVEDKLILKLSESGRFRIIDRKDIEVLLKEQALTMSGIVENSKMAELGKLKGAEAFLFGKVDVVGNMIIINLQLKEVATGMILWSSELKGRDYTQVTIGTGVRLGQYIADSWVNVDGKAADFGERTNNDGIYVAFLFNFIQRLYKSQFWSFGVDGIFSLGLWSVNRTAEALDNVYTMNSTIQWRDYNLTLIPVLRLHLAKLLNPKGEDFFIIYGGTGISTDYIQLVADSDQLDKNGEAFATADPYDSGLHHSTGGFSYKLGFEVIFSPRFSMFFEGYHLPDEQQNYTPIANITEYVKYRTGNYYGIGARYYIKAF
jgi:TolB-like protein